MLPFIQSSYLATLLECFSAGVVIMNIRGDVYACNDTAGRLLGMPRDRLVQSRFDGEMLDPFEKRAEVEEFLAAAMGHDTLPYALQSRYSHPAEGVRHYTLSASRLVEYDKVFGIVLQIGDVTHIYEMHEREKRMLEEQSLLQQERIEGLGRLSMSIAHQIRNPLMTIAGFARLLDKKNNLNESNREFLNGILDGAGRLDALVRAVTEFTAPVSPVCQEVDMAEVMAGVLARVGGLPEGVSVHVDSRPGCWFLDPGITGNALYELVMNAVEACSPQGGMVQVTAQEEERENVMEVRDDGPGFKPDAFPFLCDPFFTNKAVGVGMGLAKARRWIREQGGDIVFSNSPVGGAVASVRMPRACVLKSPPK